MLFYSIAIFIFNYSFLVSLYTFYRLRTVFFCLGFSMSKLKLYSMKSPSIIQMNLRLCCINHIFWIFFEKNMDYLNNLFGYINVFNMSVICAAGSSCYFSNRTVAVECHAQGYVNLGLSLQIVLLYLSGFLLSITSLVLSKK